MSIKYVVAVSMIVGVCPVLAGCGKPAENKPAAVAKSDVETDAHGGWWCNEHGVPEEECPLCDPKLVAKYKDKGDWCSKHERPDSQCFACHPEKQAEWAAQYEAKYGKQPPKPTDNGA
jgi:hypothetical protein